jgi:hypothetical protein
LANFDPKRLKYDISAVNNTIRIAVKKIRSAGPVTDQEIFHFQFKIYKRIKSPPEWTSYIMHLENSVGANLAYTPDQLYSEVENRHNKLVDQGLWKPTDRSPEEQAIAMIAQASLPKAKPKEKASDKQVAGTIGNAVGDGKQPPFIKSAGKEGDTKKWKDEIWNYCPSTKHKHGPWHKHKVSDCNTLKKELAGAKTDTGTAAATSTNDAVTVDKEKILRGMAALFPNGDTSAEDLTAALMAAMGE